MRSILITVFFLLSLNVFSQELNVGGAVGMPTIQIDRRIITFSATAEYKPYKSFWSFNLDPSLILVAKPVLTAPLYLKLNIGNKVRVCPTFGLFIRTNAHYGWTAGLQIELMLRKKFYVYVKGVCYNDYWKAKFPDHFGTSYEALDRSTSVWISLGIKKNIMNKN